MSQFTALRPLSLPSHALPCALPPLPLSLLLSSSCPMKHVFNFFAVNKLNLEKESDEIEEERERRRGKRARRGAENELSTRTKHANEKFVCSFCRCPRKKKWLIVMRVTRTTLPIHRHIYTTISSIYTLLIHHMRSVMSQAFINLFIVWDFIRKETHTKVYASVWDLLQSSQARGRA